MTTTKTFKAGQRVQITRGTDRGKTGTIYRVVEGQTTLYIISADTGQCMNTQAPCVKASSLKAL
jgi:ribosomal protein L24